jgi:hypothetical protein
MPQSAHGVAGPTRKSMRDPRVDFLRGVALLMIFIDHVPGNTLALFTLRNFGFSDAAELFVLLAGFSSMMAYGGAFAREGPVEGLRRVLTRVLWIYLYQAAMLAVVLVGVGAWIEHFGVEPASGAPFVHSGLEGLGRALLLQAQPASLNILPLYILLLLLFPVIYGLIRVSPALAMLVSGGLWLAVNLDPHINLTNWLDGRGWFFNPFAWQFLFTIGAILALVVRNRRGDLPNAPWLRIPAWIYLGFALLWAAPWVTWGLTEAHLIPLATPNKTTLAPLRLFDVLAMAGLALGSQWFRQLSASRGVSWIVACGRHSLEVFSLGTLLAMMSRLVFHTFGVTPTIELLTNVTGLALMVATALILEWWRLRQAARPAPAIALPPGVEPGFVPARDNIV